MAVDTIAGLKAKMPVGQEGGTSVTDLHDLIDTMEDRTTQALVTVSANYGVALTDNRRRVIVTAASAINIIFPNNTPAGFELVIVQTGAGVATIQATGGAVQSRDSHTKTAGQWAVVYAFCYSNAGTAPQIILTGDTAA